MLGEISRTLSMWTETEKQSSNGINAVKKKLLDFHERAIHFARPCPIRSTDVLVMSLELARTKPRSCHC